MSKARPKAASQSGELIWPCLFGLLLLGHNVGSMLVRPHLTKLDTSADHHLTILFLAVGLVAAWLDSQGVELPPSATFSTGWTLRIGLAISLAVSSVPSGAGFVYSSLLCIPSVLTRMLIVNTRPAFMRAWIGYFTAELLATATCLELFVWVFSNPSLASSHLTALAALGLPCIAGLVFYLFRNQQAKRLITAVPIQVRASFQMLWYSSRKTEILVCASLALAGGTFQSLSDGPTSALALVGLVGLLYASHLSLANEVFRVQSKHAFQLRQESGKLEDELRLLFRQNDQTRSELQATQNQRNILDHFTQLLSQSASMQSLAQLLRETVQQSVSLRSFVIFKVDKSSGAPSFEPVFVSSPEAKRLEQFSLVQLPEPVLLEAWRTASPSFHSFSSSDPTRFFTQESDTVALPLGSQYTLYLGRSGKGFEQSELQWILWLCKRAVPALYALEQRIEQSQALTSQTQARQLLEQEVGWLSSLLQISQELSLTFDSQALQQSLPVYLQRLFTFESAVFNLPQKNGQLQWLFGHSDGHSLLLALGQKVQEFAKPLIFEVAQPNAKQWAESVAIVPLRPPSGSQATGFLGICARPKAQYARMHQDLLSFLGNLLVVCLEKNQIMAELEISQRQLFQSSKMSAVGQLAAGVAHELNTPLGAVRLLLELAEDQVLNKPEPARQKIQKSLATLLKAQTIIEKLLTYSAAKPSQQVAHRLIEPASVVSEACELLQPELKKRQTRLNLITPPEGSCSAAIRGDSVELQQILVNLILNASDATADLPEDRRTLEVGWKASQIQVEYWVQDAGPGIEPAILDKIFDPFFTTKPVGQGTGLGLAISQKIAEDHGGKLEVRSVVGRGTRFSLVIPCAASAKFTP